MYQIILTGVREGVARPDAVKNLAALFKATPEQVEKLLASSGHIVKKDLTAEIALKYKAAIEATGATCRMEQEITPVQTLDVDLPPSTIAKNQRPERSPATVASNPHQNIIAERWGLLHQSFLRRTLISKIGLVAVSLILLFGIGAQLKNLVKVSGKQPTSGTWTCDNASQNYRPWQEWTFGSDGSLITNTEGFKSSGHYVWESAERLNTTFADDPEMNQTWYIIKASDDGWLMSNGRFQVVCYH